MNGIAPTAAGDTDQATLADIDEINKRIDEVERKFKEAFPNGDYVGHCRYHEVQIEMLLERRKLIAEIQSKTIGGLVWALMLGIALAVWQWLKTEVVK